MRRGLEGSRNLATANLMANGIEDSPEQGLDRICELAVEAQLCETPVIAFDSGGLPDIVQHDRTGVLVTTIDATALAAGITSLLDRPDRGAALGAAGRLHALATFAPESVAKRYTDVYNSAIASSPQ